MLDRIECPECNTSYTLERCGLKVPANPVEWLQATIVCSVCKRQIEVAIHSAVFVEPVVTNPPRWKVWEKPTTSFKTTTETRVLVK